MNDNDLDYDLAKSVGEFFRLNNDQMNEIIEEVLTAITTWKKVAIEIGISKKEQELMVRAFNI